MSLTTKTKLFKKLSILKPKLVDNHFQEQLKLILATPKVIGHLRSEN